MNPLLEEVSTGRARANRLRWWWQQRMGWPGGLALALIAAGVVVAAWVRPGIATVRAELVREQVARLAALERQKTLMSVATRVDPREQIRSTVPALPRRGETVAQLLDLAGMAGVSVERAEYAAEDQEPNLSRLKITLPFGGSYAQTRAVIARVLNGLPNAALDSVEIERPGAETKTLEGTLRLSLYFRKEAL